MPRIHPGFALLLVLALTACAPASHTRSSHATDKTGSVKKAAPAAPQRAAPLVMGQPLPTTGAPGTQAPAQPAAPTATPPATQAVAPASPITAPTGFGGLVWGASARSDPGLAVYDEDKATGVTTCVWPQGPRDIAGAPIRDAFYEFYQDRFYHVWIDLDSMTAYKKALAGLIQNFGPPADDRPEKYYHAWTIDDVNIYCAFHPAVNEGDVSFFYQPIYEPLMASRKAAAKSAPRSPRK